MSDIAQLAAKTDPASSTGWRVECV